MRERKILRQSKNMKAALKNMCNPPNEDRKALLLSPWENCYEAICEWEDFREFRQCCAHVLKRKAEKELPRVR